MIKYYILSGTATLLCLLFCMSLVSGYYEQKVDITSVNEIKSAVTQWRENKEDRLDGRSYFYDFTVVDMNGMILYSTKETKVLNYDTFIHEAIRDHETVLYDSAGAIAIYTNEATQAQQKNLRRVLLATGGLLLLIQLLAYWKMQNQLLRPFQRLQQFAAAIANGNLDLALPMDKSNVFGAFTESFDLMRSEWKAAKEKAILLEKQKTEMVASLSHDIKTPLSSLTAVAEMLLLTETDEQKINKLRGIEQKSSEIEILVTNLFQTTLEDLSELKVEVESHSSIILAELIRHADLLQWIKDIPEVPPCMIRLDPLRMGQVLNNIVSNAYKYANAQIDVVFELVFREKKMLLLQIKDQGHTFLAEEVNKLGHKFYRGNNAKGKQGSGLGLYNCKILMARMGGAIEFAQEQDGFCVRLYICLG